MSNTNDRTPAEVFTPGEFLRDVLAERGWTQTEFAEILGRPVQLVNEIIAAKRSITPETAKEIAAAVGTSAQYWLNLESAYQLSKASPAAERISREAALREKFPVREMIKRGWIKATKSHTELQDSIFSFFGVSSIEEEIGFGHAARRDYKKKLSEIQWAWIYRVRQLASALQVPRYSESKLREALNHLELLMTEPEEIRHIPKILADCGARFVIVEPIPGSKIDGVCFWIDSNQCPVIGLSLKGDQIDKFWFTLRHEIEHVLRGDGKDGPMVDDFDDATQPAEDGAESAANDAAADFCVPKDKMASFVARHYPMFSEPSFIGFSRLVKRHPGIVAGQLQRRIDRWDLFKKHQAKIRHIITQTALTDGYGRVPPVTI